MFNINNFNILTQKYIQMLILFKILLKFKFKFTL